LLLCTSCQQKGKIENYEVTAHRGGAGLAPENTLAALQNAMELKAGYSEIDVQETKDGKIILLHDNTLERTAGVARNIWDMPYDSLQLLDVGGWFAPEFAGEKIITLGEAIDAVKGKMRLNIELKRNKHEVVLVEKVLRIIDEKNFQDQCMLTSFSKTFVTQVRALNPDITLGFIFSKYREEFDVFELDVDLLSVKYTLVDQAFVDKAHASGKKVAVWTVNDPAMMKNLLELGVDTIITDYPDRLMKVLDEMQGVTA